MTDFRQRLSAIIADRIAEKVLEVYGTPRNLFSATEGEMRAQGVPRASARKLAAVADLAREWNADRLQPGARFRTGADIHGYFSPTLRDLQKEQLWVVILDGKNRVKATPHHLSRRGAHHPAPGDRAALAVRHVLRRVQRPRPVDRPPLPRLAQLARAPLPTPPGRETLPDPGRDPGPPEWNTCSVRGVKGGPADPARGRGPPRGLLHGLGPSRAFLRGLEVLARARCALRLQRDRPRGYIPGYMGGYIPRGSEGVGVRTVNGLQTRGNAGVELEAAPGFEPGDNGFAIRRLTTWLCRPCGRGEQYARGGRDGPLSARAGP